MFDWRIHCRCRGTMTVVSETRVQHVVDRRPTRRGMKQTDGPGLTGRAMRAGPSCQAVGDARGLEGVETFLQISDPSPTLRCGMRPKTYPAEEPSPGAAAHPATLSHQHHRHSHRHHATPLYWASRPYPLPLPCPCPRPPARTTAPCAPSSRGWTDRPPLATYSSVPPRCSSSTDRAVRTRTLISATDTEINTLLSKPPCPADIPGSTPCATA